MLAAQQILQLGDSTGAIISGKMPGSGGMLPVSAGYRMDGRCANLCQRLEGANMIPRLAITSALAIAAAATSQTVHAQGQAEIGRYQIAIPINSDSTALLIDTVTGRSWALGSKSDRRWHDLNFGEVKGGHLMLTPQPCTEDNPTCYFATPKTDKESPQKPQ